MTDDIDAQLAEATRGLTKMQAAYVRERVKNGGDKAAAAEAAGYKGGASQITARVRELETNPRIIKAIDLFEKKKNSECLIDLDWWVRKNLELLAVCMATRELKDGTIKMVDGTESGRTLERLAKHLGAYKADKEGGNAIEMLAELVSMVDGKAKGRPNG